MSWSLDGVGRHEAFLYFVEPLLAEVLLAGPHTVTRDRLTPARRAPLDVAAVMMHLPGKDAAIVAPLGLVGQAPFPPVPDRLVRRCDSQAAITPGRGSPTTNRRPLTRRFENWMAGCSTRRHDASASARDRLMPSGTPNE